MINGTRAEEGMSEEPMNEPSRKARPGMLFTCKQPESACGNKLKIEVATFSPKGRTQREKIDDCIEKAISAQVLMDQGMMVSI